MLSEVVVLIFGAGGLRDACSGCPSAASRSYAAYTPDKQVTNKAIVHNFTFIIKQLQQVVRGAEAVNAVAGLAELTWVAGYRFCHRNAVC